MAVVDTVSLLPNLVPTNKGGTMAKHNEDCAWSSDDLRELAKVTGDRTDNCDCERGTNGKDRQDQR